MDPDQILDALDDEQRDAASCLGVRVGVIAGAGTGKTRTLTHRIAYGAAMGELDPGSTLAVTFTTAAASEVGSRLESMGVVGVASRTFHSACLRQAQYFWPEVYHSELPPVIDNREPLVIRACERLGITPGESQVREVLTEISWTKQTNVVPEAYVELASADQRRTRLSLEQMADVLVAYEEAKQTDCVIDLDDILLCTLALLATESVASRQVRGRYRHFLFDEFQDVSPVQARLVEEWVGDRKDVCVVGDPAQTIHSFAGSRSEYLTRFASTGDGRECRLTTNYRSTPEILQAACLVGGSHLSARRPSGVEVDLSSAVDRLDESTQIAKWLQGLHKKQIEWSGMAVLARTGFQLQGIRQILADHQVPSHLGGEACRTSAKGVTLATLHASKGQEWEAVGLVGLHDGAIPHPLAVTTEQIEEERRLLYVGMTRAKSFLRLSWPQRVDNLRCRPSRFLAGLTSSLAG